MKRRQIRIAYNALVALSRKALPTEAADERVARLLRQLQMAAEDIEQVRASIIKQYPAPENDVGAQAINERREMAFVDYLNTDDTSMLSPPPLVLTSADLPSTERAGLASLIADLGPFYIFPTKS